MLLMRSALLQPRHSQNGNGRWDSALAGSRSAPDGDRGGLCSLRVQSAGVTQC